MSDSDISSRCAFCREPAACRGWTSDNHADISLACEACCPHNGRCGPISIQLVHEIKCWPWFFDKMANHKKMFEIRKNDRAYRVGDALWIMETDGNSARPVQTGRCLFRRIVFITAYAQRRGFVVMGLKPDIPPSGRLQIVDSHLIP